MAQKVNIIQSETEPNTNDLWLHGNDLKVFNEREWKKISNDGAEGTVTNENIPILTSKDIPANLILTFLSGSLDLDGYNGEDYFVDRDRVSNENTLTKAIDKVFPDLELDKQVSFKYNLKREDLIGLKVGDFVITEEIIDVYFKYFESSLPTMTDVFTYKKSKSPFYTDEYPKYDFLITCQGPLKDFNALLTAGTYQPGDKSYVENGIKIGTTKMFLKETDLFDMINRVPGYAGQGISTIEDVQTYAQEMYDFISKLMQKMVQTRLFVLND